MEGAALRIVTHEPDNSWRDDRDVILPVPLWVFSLDVGPALGLFLGYCCGQCNLLGADSFETSLGKLRDDFPGKGERAISRWIEELRPWDDDYDGDDTKYARLGFLRCSKRELKGFFDLRPLRPLADGVKPTPRDPGPQTRLPLLDQLAAGMETGPPQTLAPNSAVGSPQGLAQDPAVLAERLHEALRHTSLADYCGDETEWRIEGATVIVTVPHNCFKLPYQRAFGSVIEPACRDVFPRGECFELRLGHSPAPALFDGGRDPPQGFAQNPAVLFKVKFSLVGSLKGNQLNELKVQVKLCAPQILARADAIADRLAPVPKSFFRWQWIQAAWAIETGKIPESDLESTLGYCLGRDKPAWQFARSAPDWLFAKHRIGWLDARRPREKAALIERLSAVGLAWDDSWEGQPHQPKPR